MRRWAGNKAVASAIGGVGVILWATEPTLITYTVAIPPLQTVALAFIFAAAMSPLVWLVTGSHPLLAFRQPLSAWLLTVGSLVGYHACIYYATQKAPPAAAALLQGTTPLMIVLGSALLPGEKLKWWHVLGALMGLAGVLCLIDNGGDGNSSDGAVFYLSLIGIAASLWGLYSVLTRRLADVPTSTLGIFYAASAIVAGAAHFSLEKWVSPTGTEWLAMAALGCLPMGLAIYFWDFGLKRGDIQALGTFSYVEPLIGTVLVAMFTHAVLNTSLLWAGLLVVGGAVVGSASLWTRRPNTKPEPISADERILRGAEIAHSLGSVSTKEELSSVSNQILARLIEIGGEYGDPRKHDEEMKLLLSALAVSIRVWDECQAKPKYYADEKERSAA
ncbi:DMT family transporter [Rhizobium sp. RAF56]|uniref:DMT family transporter n=1 Tax=Rhizobium sp. RAF56 TaxID=3233062 RepID=UPI003F9AEB75